MARSVEERYNQIVNNVNQKLMQQQSTYERYNRIVERANANIATREIEEKRKQEQQLEQQRKDQQKQQEMKQLNQKLNSLSEEDKNAIYKQVQKQNMQLKVHNAENVSKDLGVSKEEAENLIKKSNSLPSKISQAYKTNYGENGFAGVNAMANEIKKTPEVLQKIKETSVESPITMGLRGAMAGTVDAGTTEVASLFEEPEEEKWYEKNVIARQAKTFKRVYDKAQRISQNGGNALDVLWGAGSTLATGTLKNTLDSMPGRQMMNLAKRTTQKVMNTALDEDTRKQLQKTMLGLTDSYYQDRAKYQENESKKSKTQQYIDTVLEGTSRMGGSIATTYVTGNPNMGLIATGLSAKGSATQEALREGATLEQAIDVGNLSGLVEMATEKIWSGIKLPGGKSLYGNSLGDAVENFVLSKLKTQGGKWLASKGMDIAGEIAEEFISDTLESVAKQGIYDDNAKLPTAKDYWNTATTTAGTTVLLNLLTGGFLQAPNINNQNTEKTTNQNTELLEKVQKASKEYAEKNNISNLQQNDTINQNVNQQQQISQIENKNSLNQNVEGQSETKFSKILNNQKLPMQSYIYEKSDNLKVDSLRQQANKYFNNSQEAHNFVNMLEKIIEDKNIAINFDTNLAEDVNGYYNNGVITINPNSTRAGEFLAIHELTHAIGTDSMIKMIDNYRKSNAEFDSQVQKLLQKYNKSEISEEALADIAGQLFGNQEYINNLSKTNPNMFKRIYNEIKYLWHQFRGYKNQDQFVDDLMYKWEQAYRKQNKANDSSIKYSIQIDSNGKQFIQVDTDQNIFDGIDTKDYNKIAKMYIQDYLLGKTTLSENDTASIENKSASKYTNPGQAQYYFPEKMKLTPELKNVLQIAEKVSKSKPNKQNSKYSNWEYYKFRFSLDGNNFEGLVNIGIDKAGNKHFYEINNIKKTSILGTSPNNRTGLSNNSIAPSNENVNTAKYSVQESENNSGSFNLSQKQIQGLENYSRDEIKDIAKNYIQVKLQENGLDDINIIDSEIHGSRNRGNAKANSDLDIVVEYDGDIREDDLFDILNEKPLYIDGIKVDINPITASKTGTLQEYMEKSNKYDQEILDKNKSSNLTGIESKQYLEQKFKELTGDSILKADAVLGGVDLRNSTRNDGQVEKYPYSKEALDIYNKYKNSKKSSNYLYHSTSKENIKNIIKNGLTIGNKQNQEGISAKDKLYLSATEELSKSFAPEDNITFRINPKANLENLDNDLLGGEGSYTITNSIPVDMLQVKENGKWINLEKSQIYKDNNSINLPQTDNKGNVLSKQQQEYFKDSKVRDENGRLKVVYHTTTDTGEQFNIFDPRGTEHYRFGNQIVNYYTDSKTMSGSYANGTYEMADTNRFNSIKDAEQWLKSQNTVLDNFSIEKQGDYYSIQSNDRALGNLYFESENDLLTNLKEKFNKYRQNFGYNNHSRYQYEGFVNITNPYIIDAEGNNWNQVKTEINEYGKSLLNEIDVLEKNNIYYKLKRLYDKAEFDARKASERFQDIQKKAKPGQYEILGEYARWGNIDDIFNTGLYDETNKEEIRKHLNDKIQGKTLKDIGLDLYNNKYETLLENSINELKKQYPEISKFPLEDLDLIAEHYMGGKEYIKNRYRNKETTNDIVNKVLDMNKNGSNYDGVIIKNVVDYGGKSETNNPANVYVTFNSNQFKNQENKNPTSNPDIRYSKNSNTWQEYLEKEFPAKGTRTNMQNIKKGVLPTKETINQKNTQNKSDINLPPKVSANNQYKDTTTKVRKHYKSIIESANTTPEAKAIAKELMGTDTYIPETNKSELERADEKIMNSTPESELNSLMSRATVGEKITPVDIAVGERLIQYYSKMGDGAKLQDAIQATAMAGTTAGQTVQAMSLLNHMTPEGQAVWLQRSVDKMNNKLKKTRGKNAPQFTLNEDMLQKIVNSENEEQLTKNLNEVYQELGQQVNKSTMEKIDAWRYFSMLANPRTHIRNILGNFAMAKAQTVKNKVAGVTEGVISKFNKDMERTHTIVPASKDVKQFAKADIKNVTDRLGLTEGKLNPQTRLENNMKTFKHETMNKTIGKLFDLNNKALEVEDGWGLKAGYAKALAEYMTANKLKPNTITDAQLSKARNYAIQQAKEATFHQENQLASLVNQLSNRNKFAKFGVDAVLPFKKTPMNIAKTGIEYSPVGLAKSMVLDTVQLRKGNITVNQYIDNISKGLTGTGIALVGYALAQAGILKASGGDDDKEKYEEGRGKQAFSIQIGDNTYSLDWLAPTAIPLFIGAEISALNKATNEAKTSNSSDEDSKYNQLLKTTTNVLDAFTNSMNPMMEMSMLSGLASTLRSYEQGATQGITAMGTNAVKSYVNQFVPTALGQVAKTTDEYERSTTSTKTGMLPKAIDSTKNQIMAKVPGLRQMLPTKTDVWGNDMKQPSNVVRRALENAVLPYTRKELNNNEVDQELVRLYEERGEKSVLPSSSLSKDLTFSGEKYKMTSEEFAKYKKDYGSKSYSLINDLVNSSDYNKLSDEDKQQALENVYKYAKEYAKDQYAKANDIEYTPDATFKTAQAMEKSGNVSSYFNYLAKTDGMKEKEKMKVLVNASYGNNDKKLIYENTIGSDDSLYNTAMQYTGININEYLKYKTQEFTSDKTDDGTVDGKTVSGSKKAKVYEYVNNMKITGEQRMLLLGTQYKLTDTERATLANYVNNLKITKNEKMEIYKKLQGFTVYKDGRVTY